MHLSTIYEWLDWIAAVHPAEIELGLARVKKVAARLSVLSTQCPVITVGGTNGKGSTVAGLEAIYRAAGYQVGAFTSPFIFKHNEYVRINGQQLDDQAFCQAYAKVEAARDDTPLTQFEFYTLGALLIFQSYPLDVLILEVGLGGRLDAVNIIEADVAVVTSIAIDHVDYLGPNRETIGYEKAGIFRAGNPVVCGEVDPPQSLIDHAHHLQPPAKLYCVNKEFSFSENKATWIWSTTFAVTDKKTLTELPLATLATPNMAVVLMAITLLQACLPVDISAIHAGLKSVTLPARIQIREGPVTEIFDASHNPAAVTFLKNKLQKIPCCGRTLAVFSMLGDKDILASIKAIYAEIDTWYVAPLHVKRGASLAKLQAIFAQLSIKQIYFFPTIKEAYATAKKAARTGDRIISFGSFYTVGELLNL